LTDLKEIKPMDFSPLTRFLDTLPLRGIPGVDCVVYYKHQPVLRHHAGFADRESQKPFEPHMLYNLYSTSKVITCTAALQLFEQGKFLLNDPLSEYLPEYKTMLVRTITGQGTAELRPAVKPIRIVDLFTMSAGMTYIMNSKSILKAQAETGGRAPTREVVRALAGEPLIFEPGTHWNYALCHDVLGALIEVLSGKRFGQYLQENIFDPIGMNDTGFSRTHERLARMTTQYRFNSETGVAEAITKDNGYILGSEYESGGAGLISSVEDYGLFVDTLSNGGRAASGAKILSRTTIDLMRSNQLDEIRMKDFNWEQMAGYGYGLGVRTMIDKTRGSSSSIGEFGWGGAAGTYAMIDPDCEIAVFYAQHMLNNMEPFVHPRLRNIVYSCIF
jgi:CubicO group peptidase (beta-lactamase class C family)